MADMKVISHEPTVVTGSGQANLPPYTPGPPGSYPPPPGSGPTVIQATIAPTMASVVVAQQMGPKPTRIICKSCNNEIVTRVETKSTICTHLFAILLCGLCCCCLPYLMSCGMNSEHYCPNCNAYIGTHHTT